MPKLKKYVVVKNKYVCNTILQMKLQKKLLIGPKDKAMDFSNYNERHMQLLIGSLKTFFGVREVNVVMQNE